MMIRLILLIAALAATALVAPPTWAQQSGARIYILDASNSMTRTRDYPGNTSRLAVAKQVLLDELKSLAARGDGLPTAVYVFGSRTNWDRTRRRSNGRYRTAADYPHDGPLCQDNVKIGGFTTVENRFVRQMRQTLSETSAGGMTPINVAIKQALEQLVPYGGGEIILISDYESPNCLPPGENICTDIQQHAQEIRMDLKAVKIGIFKVPESNLRADLQNCLPVTEHPISPTSEPNEEDTPLVPELKVELATAYTERAMSPAPPDPQTLRFTLSDVASGRIVRSGTLGPVNVAPGTYRIALRHGNQEWKRTVRIQQSQRLEIPVNPGILIIEPAEADTPATVDLFRIDSAGRETQLGQVRLASTSTRLVLGTGQFKIVGRSQGRTLEHRMELSLGETKTIALHLDRPPQVRRAVITLQFPMPTIRAGGFIRPDVTLHQNGRTIRQLFEGDNTLELAPGRYDIAIASRRPHMLPLTVKPNDGQFAATVEVTPGWFEADPGHRGTFVLFDGKGNTIAQFEGARAAHSLPDGAYRLEFSGSNGKKSRADFDISQGRLTEILLR